MIRIDEWIQNQSRDHTTTSYFKLYRIDGDGIILYGKWKKKIVWNQYFLKDVVKDIDDDNDDNFFSIEFLFEMVFKN